MMLGKIFLVSVIVYCVIGAVRHISGLNTDKQLKKLIDSIDVKVD